MATPYFITGTGTGVGKTLLTTALCWQLRQHGREVHALKPIISGYDAADPGSDLAQILSSLRNGGNLAHPALHAGIAPWRLGAPLSPDMAAAREGLTLNLNEIVDFCRHQAETQKGTLLVEGVGGVMTPLAPRTTILDLMATLAWPALLVTGSYLGSLSHTLTAAAALLACGLDLRAIVISESENAPVVPEEMVACLRSHLPASIRLISLPRLDLGPEMWKYAPDITQILA